MKIENIKYNSFDEFLNDLLLPKGQLTDKLYGFIFRGERTNRFKLLPGALREDQMGKLYGAGKPIENQSQWLTWQVHAEYTLLREFYKISNHNGLKVPKVEAISKNYIDVFPSELIHQNTTFKWVSDGIAELAALAQHYGVLTRLIDWSYELYVALYFACIGAIRQRERTTYEENDTMVIWALNAYYIQFLQPTVSRIPLNFIVPAYHDNPNLNAQKGVLSYWEIDVPGMIEQVKELEQGLVRITDRTPLDKLLQKYCDANPEKNPELTILYKLELPVSECIAVYDFLRRTGYTAAKLFPDYNGVVKDMEETALVYRVKEMIKAAQ